jgi:CHAD domain
MAKARPIAGLDPQAPTGKNAQLIAKVRLEEVYSWESSVDQPANIRELHNLRIAAKRLRYTFEVFKEVLPVACQPLHQELVQVQDELGVLHDTEVMIALLQLCLGSHETATVPETAQRHANKHHSQEQALVAFELVRNLLDPATAPSADERSGLAQYLQRQQQVREEHYAAFRQHWDALQARDFKRQVLDALEREQSWMKQQKGRHSHAIIFRRSIGLVATTPANS